MNLLFNIYKYILKYIEIILSFLFEFSDIRRCGEEYDKEWKS